MAFERELKAFKAAFPTWGDVEAIVQRQERGTLTDKDKLAISLLRVMLNEHISEGQKVVHTPTGKVFDFGYYSQSQGRAVIYEQGERNMQDSVVVWISDLEKV